MTTGDKLARLRKENNYTQEQLAELLGVSRQAVSKWESDLAFPETEKLIRISELYGCSVDYLLKEDVATPSAPEAAQTVEDEQEDNEPLFKVHVRFPKEKISKITILGLPLYHIGRDAKGIFAFGLKARGIFSFGIFSMGVVSFGVFSLGLLAMGVLAIGCLAFGSFALGILSAGAICLGIFSAGAISVGELSVGAVAIGKYAALGDYARGMIAIGQSEAHGALFERAGDLSAADVERVRELLRYSVPEWLGWAKSMFAALLSAF